MAVRGVEQVGERPLEELLQNASQEAVALAPGLALVGGGAFLTALASGTGTATLILLLARRPGPSAAAFAVTAAYAGAGAYLAREGLVRLKESGLPLPDTAADDEPATNAEEGAKSRTKSRAQSSARRKPDAKSPTPRRRATRTQKQRGDRRKAGQS
jgi:hypothetical protein